MSMSDAQNAFLARHKKTILIVGVLVVLGGGYYGRQKSSSNSTVVQYKTATVEKGMLTTSVSGSGNVVVDQISNVDPTISGTVTNLAVKVGDAVKRGQLLFTIDNDQLSVDLARSYASLLQSQQSVESARANRKQAELDYDDASGEDKRVILKKKITAADIGVTAAEQSLSASRADYQKKKADANKRNVTSPINGTVNAVNIKNGDDLGKLSSNSNRQAPIIVGDLSTLKAYVQVNEVDIPNVSIGQKAMLKFTAIDGLAIAGKVEKMDALGTITQGVVTYNVTISFDTLDLRIRPAMSVSASIITGAKQGVLLVPNSAVKSQGNASYVEILNGSAAPKQVTVEIGASNNTDTEIVSGVSAGDKVVTQTIDPNAKSTTAAGGQGGSGFRVPGLGGGGR
ncbi:efflux RND transporter periplasmic adaptor subunit [Patescibacteria group bacterium]|nr:MAG: efflux RND transporter periplasmic adaptor subunit [Patescibacteria group bacterium]